MSMFDDHLYENVSFSHALILTFRLRAESFTNLTYNHSDVSVHVPKQDMPYNLFNESVPLLLINKQIDSFFFYLYLHYIL